MIKLLDILKELNIQKKTQLGSGDNVEGETYDFISSPDKVVKKYTNINPEFKYAQYNFMSKYPEFFVKVYKITPKYVVLEKVKVPIPGLKELQRFVNTEANINWKKGTGSDPDTASRNVYATDIISGMYKEVKTRKNKVFSEILNKAEELNNFDIQNLLVKIWNFLNKLEKKVPGVEKFWFDIQKGNIGEDVNGKLKLFDIGYEDEWGDY